jgi:hypothetical protein
LKKIEEQLAEMDKKEKAAESTAEAAAVEAVKAPATPGLINKKEN